MLNYDSVPYIRSASWCNRPERSRDLNWTIFVFHHRLTISLRGSLFETSLATLTCPGNLNTMQNTQYQGDWMFEGPRDQNIRE